VEHPCYKCQSPVEEGVPFCPHCSAPQIRVLPPEPDIDQPARATPDVQSPQQADTGDSLWGHKPSTATPHQPIQWKQALPGALMAGAGAAVLSSLPVLGFGCCLWLLAAGVISVYLYQKRLPGTLIAPGMGMRIGALAGGVAFALQAVMSTLLFATEGDQVRKALEEQLQASMAKAPDPRTQEILHQFMAKINTPDGMATFFLWVLVLMALVFVLFCGAGGALGASMTARRRGLR
jgi:hypothetical protein